MSWFCPHIMLSLSRRLLSLSKSSLAEGEYIAGAHPETNPEQAPGLFSALLTGEKSLPEKWAVRTVSACVCFVHEQCPKCAKVWVGCTRWPRPQASQLFGGYAKESGKPGMRSHMAMHNANTMVMSVGSNNRRTCCVPRSSAKQTDSVARP